jgi:amino acid permease
MMPGAFKGPDFVFTYGAFLIFAGLYIIFKTFEVIVQKKPFRLAVPAKEIDFHSDLEYIEALTAASDAQRASHKKSAGKRVSDWLF